MPIAVAAHVHLAQHALDPLERLDFARERRGEGFELLPEGHRHRVLQLGAPHLEDLSRTPSPSARNDGDQLVACRRRARWLPSAMPTWSADG